MRFRITLILVGLSLFLVSDLSAQQVYRCLQADGSTTFSDLPCRSDRGVEDRVDATPHQGHGRSGSASPEPLSPAEPKRTRAGDKPATADSRLPRRERLALEQRRRELLSGLKRRHLEPGERRAMVRALREVDGKLGIDREAVADMPYHNREIYEDYRIFRD